MCSRHWNGKIYREKQGKCDSDIFAIEFGRREVIIATLVGYGCIRQCVDMCVSLRQSMSTQSVIGKTLILPLKALKL